MPMAADTGHRFWLGEVNMTIALARGEITADGAGGEDPAAGAALEGGLSPLQAAARGAGPSDLSEV